MAVREHMPKMTDRARDNGDSTGAVPDSPVVPHPGAPEGAARKPRPWWRRRRFIGGCIAGVGLIVAAVPGAPVIVTLGAVQITTTVVSVACTQIGGIIAGYGLGHKHGRETEPKMDR